MTMAPGYVLLVLFLQQLEVVVSQEACTPPAGQPGCVCETDQGIIDLTSLGTGDTSKAVFADIPDTHGSGYTFSYSPCYGFQEPTGACSTEVVAACQESADFQYPLGAIDQETMFTDSATGSVYLQYLGGDSGRSVIVYLQCPQDQSTSIIAEGDYETQLTYVFYLSTPCACPGQCGSSTPPHTPPHTPSHKPPLGHKSSNKSGYIGIILIMLAFIGLVTYFIVGSVINYIRLQKRGLTVLPQKDIWFDFPFLVKDGILFTFGPCIRKYQERRVYQKI